MRVAHPSISFHGHRLSNIEEIKHLQIVWFVRVLNKKALEVGTDIRSFVKVFIIFYDSGNAFTAS